MYAPKFRSWMSSWDRFEEALEARIQAQGEAILADVRRQIAEAMPKEPPKEPAWKQHRDWYLHEIPEMLKNIGQSSAYARELANQANPFANGLSSFSPSSLFQQLLGPGPIARL